MYHVTDYDRIVHTVIASGHQTVRLFGIENLAMIVFTDNHPMAPEQPVFQIKANFVKTIEIIREANLLSDEPVSAWTSGSDLPRPEACSESVQ